MLRKLLLIPLMLAMMTSFADVTVAKYVATVKNYYSNSTVNLIPGGMYPNVVFYYCPVPASGITNVNPKQFVYGGVNCGNTSKNQFVNLGGSTPSVTYALNVPGYGDILSCNFAYGWTKGEGCTVTITPSQTTNWATCTATAVYSETDRSCQYQFIFQPKR